MPKMLSARTVGLVRGRVAQMLTETCTLQRESGATGTMGEPLHDDWLIVAADVPCRVIRVGEQQRRTSVQQVGAQESMVERYRLICPVGTAFDVDDRVVMSDGRIFQVADVQDGLTDEAYCSALITRVR